MPVFHGIAFGSVSTEVATRALEPILLPGPPTFNIRELPAAPKRGSFATSIGEASPSSAAAAAAAAAPAATAAAAVRARRGFPIPMDNFLLASWNQNCNKRLVLHPFHVYLSPYNERLLSATRENKK